MSAARILRGTLDGVGTVALPPVEHLRAGDAEHIALAHAIEEAERRGEERGRAAGEAAARQLLEAERAALASTREALASVLRRLERIGRESLEADVVEVVTLALELAREVLAAEVVPPRERIEAWVGRVLAERDVEELTVRLAPPASEDLADTLVELAEREGARLRVERDVSLEPYDVVVELGAGVLDLTVKGAFERVLQELRELGQ
ncbi:hypothetical protein Afer_0139 [Acidimicrobium ferrooxidans DSM 10331]|uniref:Uncharacterized protein n=1 Tax=Acidimicrobium ferrooxidans (strain DSM 10331 / JCM 15462 / NBRC 103882 / ICP) TaxID=525909 RepID=C7M210_ACIFD|nr:FliH/SctL family protein [Acidimicrobium ferrooxidans]ACU53108.1 hypothetical protein Afer_0139 [Acidimicrobium ferrooxidans DSM 10331]